MDKKTTVTILMCSGILLSIIGLVPNGLFILWLGGFLSGIGFEARNNNEEN
jgi:hypothetical protein